ncbi:MAG: CRISPR-associated endonuclease Cas2 [Bacillota bacterium]
MHTLVIYDIPSTKIRTKIAEACLDYGLDRIQWSAFLGDINHNRREELEAKLKKVLGRRAGNIQLIPVCEKDLGLRVIIEVRKEDERKDSKEKPRKRRQTKEGKSANAANAASAGDIRGARDAGGARDVGDAGAVGDVGAAGGARSARGAGEGGRADGAGDSGGASDRAS